MTNSEYNNLNWVVRVIDPSTEEETILGIFDDEMDAEDCAIDFDSTTVYDNYAEVAIYDGEL